MYWKKKRRQFLAAIGGLVVGASIPAYIDTHPKEYQDMLKWLRSKFGKCKDRWTHDWKVSKQGVDVELNDSRTCSVCGCRQVCIGHHSFMDADSIPQWQETKAPATCDHDYEIGPPHVVVCSKNNLDMQFKFRFCKHCNTIEVYDKGGWTESGAYLVLAYAQWDQLKQTRHKDSVLESVGEKKARGLSGKYRSIDD